MSEERTCKRRRTAGVEIERDSVDPEKFNVRMFVDKKDVVLLQEMEAKRIIPHFTWHLVVHEKDCPECAEDLRLIRIKAINAAIDKAMADPTQERPPFFKDCDLREVKEMLNRVYSDPEEYKKLMQLVEGDKLINEQN